MRTPPRSVWSVFTIAVLLGGCALQHGPPEDGGLEDGGALDTDGVDAGDVGVDAPGEPAVIDDILCDDLDPCTLGIRVAGTCVSMPATDGTRCDDADVCTLGDHCEVGRCVGGPRSTESPRVVSLSQPTYRGASLGIGDGRFLFFPVVNGGTDILLARLDGDDLVTSDDAHLALTTVTRAFWLGDEHIAWVAGHDVGLLTIEGDHIAVGPRTTLATVSGGAFALTESTFWVCTHFLGPSDLVAFDTSDPSVLVERARSPLSGSGCMDVRASRDRGRVFVATGEDTLVVTAGAAIVDSLGVPAQSLHVGGSFITATTPDHVRLLRESDGMLVAELSNAITGGAIVAARVTRRGLEVLTDERDGGLTNRTLTIYSVAPGTSAPLTPVASAIVRSSVAPADPVSVWASQDDALLDGQRLFSLSRDAPFLHEIRDPHRFWPFWMRASGATLALRDDQAAIMLDITDPTRPDAVVGGEFVGVSAASIEVPADGAIGLYGVRTWWPSAARQGPGTLVVQGIAHVRMMARAFDAMERPEDLGMRVMPDGTDAIDATYRHVYARSLDAAATHLRVTRWRGDQFASSSSFEPLLDRTVVSDAPITVVAPLQGDRALAFVTAPDAAHSNVHWAALDGTATAELVGLDLQILDLVVRDDRLFALARHPTPGHTVSTDHLVFLALAHVGEGLVEVGRQTWMIPETSVRDTLNPMRVLRFDGETAYVQLPLATPTERGASVFAFAVDDLASWVRYPLESSLPIFSATETDVGLAFAGPGGVTIVLPFCH